MRDQCPDCNGTGAKDGHPDNEDCPKCDGNAWVPRDWSAIPKQTHLTENGEIGDCWRCCIAAVIGEPASNVPHFLDGGDGAYNSGCDAETQNWLNLRGWILAFIPGEIYFPRWASDASFPHPALILAGPTPRSQEMGQHHAVVGDVRNKLLYDPHPSESGLTAITERWLLFRV